MTQTTADTRTCNKVQFIGRIGKDPRAGKSEKGLTKFSLVVEQVAAVPMWLGVDCWEQLARDVLANKSIYKGVLVEVHGRLAVSYYEGKHYYNVVASSVEIVQL